MQLPLARPGAGAEEAGAGAEEAEESAMWKLVEQRVLIGKRRISQHWVRYTKRRPLGLLPLSFYPALCVKVVLIACCVECALWPNSAETATFKNMRLLRVLLFLVAAGVAASIVMNYGAVKFLQRLGEHRAALESMPEVDGEETSTWRGTLCQSLDPAGLAASVVAVVFFFSQEPAVFHWKTVLLALCFCLDGGLLSPGSIVMKIADALGDHFVARLRESARECATRRRGDWATFAQAYLEIGVASDSLRALDGHGPREPGDRAAPDSLRTLDDHATQMRAPSLISSALLFLAYTLTAMEVRKRQSVKLLLLIALLAFKFLAQMQIALHTYAKRTQKVMSTNRDDSVYSIVLRRGDRPEEVDSMTDPEKIDYQLALYQFEAIPVGTTLGGFLITQRFVYVTLISAYISFLSAAFSVAGRFLDD